jgi:plasmid stabilization system protein ParE
MKYAVIWLPGAEQELARIWLSTRDRAAVVAAAKRIDEMLATSPEDAGESRPEGRRILFEAPLIVTFRVYAADRQVVVSSVKEFWPRAEQTD